MLGQTPAVGDFAVETAVRGDGEGRWRAELDQAWEIWGPMGGYVAAVALRAAGASSRFRRPATFACHYLGVAEFGSVDLEVEVLRAGRSACSQRVTMTQGGRPIVAALVWSVDEVEGLEHDESSPPAVAGPSELSSVEELLGDDAHPPYPFWDNVAERPIEFLNPWPPTVELPAQWRSWLSLRPTATFADPWVDAARTLVFLDVQGWPAAFRHHAWQDPPYIAPSLDLSVAFHRPAPEEAWLLADGVAPVATDGLIGWNGRLWSQTGALVASGAGQLLCRRIAAP